MLGRGCTDETGYEGKEAHEESEEPDEDVPLHVREYHPGNGSNRCTCTPQKSFHPHVHPAKVKSLGILMYAR